MASCIEQTAGKNLPFYAAFSVSVLATFAVEPKYDHDPSKWQEVMAPPQTDDAARMDWELATNRSQYEWCVFTEDNRPVVQVSSDPLRANLLRKPHPDFNPTAREPHGKQFRHIRAFAKVNDGWIVGFNDGEFGAALYWFDDKGQRNYEIGLFQVEDFFSLPDGLYAIQGLAHLDPVGFGSIIRIARPKDETRWQATNFVNLPAAPYALSVRRDGTMLITLAQSLVSIDHDGKITTLLSDPPWEDLYPQSSVLSPDEQKLYIGMRQFVGEFDLGTRKLRLLIPSKEFLNKLKPGAP